jgi:hypothetical protein
MEMAFVLDFHELYDVFDIARRWDLILHGVGRWSIDSAARQSHMALMDGAYMNFLLLSFSFPCSGGWGMIKCRRT